MTWIMGKEGVNLAVASGLGDWIDNTAIHSTNIYQEPMYLGKI